MDTKITISNYLVNKSFPKKSTPKIPKTITSFFLFLQMYVGVDCGFAQLFSEKIAKFVIRFSTFMSIILIILLSTPFMYDKVWYWCTIVKYCIHLVLLKFTKYKIKDFLVEIHGFEESFPGIDRNFFGAAMLSYTFALYFLKGVLITIRCAVGLFCLDYKNITLYVLYCTSCISADTVSGILIVIVFYVFEVVSNTKETLKTDMDLAAFERCYVAIANCYDKIKPFYNRITPEFPYFRITKIVNSIMDISVADSKIYNVIPKYPKILFPKSTLVYFIVLQFCFGFNMGFERIFSGMKKITAKYYTRILTITLFVILISPVNTCYKEVWFWCILAKYITVSFMFNTSKYTIFDYLTDMHEFGGTTSAINKSYLGIIIDMFSFFMYILKGGIIAVCYIIGTSPYCNIIDSKIHHFVYDVAFLSNDTVFGALIFNEYYLYCIVKEIKESFKEDKDVLKLEKSFVISAGIWEKIWPVHSGLIIIELFINTPRLMVTLWCMLLYIKQNAEWYSYTSEWLFAFHLTIQMCIPAVITEMVNGQMDDIKSLLNEQIRIEKDAQQYGELRRVLRYVRARRLQGDVWRVLPLDLRLPLTLLSVCTTYFIVILQFTHLYD